MRRGTLQGLRLGVIGINEKVAELKLREQVAKACQKLFTADICCADATPLVLLSTCNRTEVYFSSDDLAATHAIFLDLLRADIELDFDQKLYSFFGKDCLQHLARVAAGLDSAIIAETEIQGQVRIAYELAAKKRQLPHELHFAFQKALKIGKQVRQELPLRRGIPDLEHAVLSAATQALPDMSLSRLLFVGASEINHKLLSFMKRKGLCDVTLCNRSHDVALEMARKHDVNLLSWESFAAWRQYDWVIFGTKSPEYLVTAKCMADQPIQTKLLIDLSVPRNVHPSVARHVSLVNIDQLHDMLQTRRDSLGHVLSHAENLVADATARQVVKFRERERRRLGLVTLGSR